MPQPLALHAAALGWIVVAITFLGSFLAAGMWWLRHGAAYRKAAADQAIRDEITEGRYHRAVPHLHERGRVAEAARLEALRGNMDEAARLYERAGDVRGAASVYLTQGDHEMAALIFKEGGHLSEAADAYRQAERPAAAAPLLEKVERFDDALAAWREAGDGVHAAELLERLGRRDEARAERAEMAEREARWHDAAQLWKTLNSTERATHAFLEAGDPGSAGRLLLEQGDLPQAASLLVKAGEFRLAAEAYARVGEKTKAAHAYYRAGDLSSAEHFLTEGEEWVTLGRLYFQHGQDDHGFRVLASVKPSDPRFEEARVLLAEAFSRRNRPQDAFRLYDELVKRRVSAKTIDADVRRWVVLMAEILFRAGRRQQAITCLKQLETLALMTPELETKIGQLEVEAGSQAELADFTSALGVPTHERYEFVAKLGEGGNGVIYRAMDRMLGRELAIKMIGATALPSDVAKKFFLREAQTAARLNHPNIVTIYDIGEIDGRSFIAMELIDGESLADRLSTKRGTIMEAPEVLPLVDDLCDAMTYAHERGVIHRDVKLENVMITTSGEVKLMDFGLAKAIQEAPDKSLIITGTPLYMSPEQISGSDVDGRTDIYALGVMLYRLLVGQWPYFEGNILEAHKTAPLPDPCEFNPHLPSDFRFVVEHTMAKDRDRRYKRAVDVAKALRKAFGMPQTA